jgi:hypothetical protein
MTTDTARDDMAATSARDRWPRWRVWTIRVWYGLLSLWALSMAQGIFLLALGRADQGDRFGFAAVPTWKLLATGAVLVICWTGGRSVVAFQALIVGWISWTLGDQLWAVQPADSTPIMSAIATIVLWFLPLLLLRPHRKELLHLRLQPSAILLPLALAAAVPQVIYAVRQGDLATDPTGAGAGHDMTLSVVLAGQFVFAALRPGGSVWLPRLVALAGAWVGLAAIIWPNDLGSFGRGWGAALIGGALVFAAAAEVETRRQRPSPPPSSAREADSQPD